LDRPLHEQYVSYLAGVARGDLGQSYRTKEPVTAAIARSVPWTAILALGAAVFQVTVGVPLGLFAALRKGRPEDMGAMAVALVGISAPTFLIGLGLMVVFGFVLGWFPL